jgi:hypothetical protein
VAAEYFWAVSFPFRDPSRKRIRGTTRLTKIRYEIETVDEARNRQTPAPRRYL